VTELDTGTITLGGIGLSHEVTLRQGTRVVLINWRNGK